MLKEEDQDMNIQIKASDLHTRRRLEKGVCVGRNGATIACVCEEKKRSTRKLEKEPLIEEEEKEEEEDHWMDMEGGTDHRRVVLDVDKHQHD